MSQCQQCEERKPYKWYSILCILCMSHIQIARDKLIGRECTPFPKKERKK